MTKIYTFSEFLFEAKKNKKASTEMPKAKKKPVFKKGGSKKKDQDGDGDSDFADAKLAQYRAGGVDHKKAMAMSRKFNEARLDEFFSSKDDKKTDAFKKMMPDLTKIKKGKKILYKDQEYTVVDSTEYVLTVKSSDGKEKKINAKMFKESGKEK